MQPSTHWYILYSWGLQPSTHWYIQLGYATFYTLVHTVGACYLLHTGTYSCGCYLHTMVHTDGACFLLHTGGYSWGMLPSTHMVHTLQLEHATFCTPGTYSWGMLSSTHWVHTVGACYLLHIGTNNWGCTHNFCTLFHSVWACYLHTMVHTVGTRYFYTLVHPIGACYLLHTGTSNWCMLPTSHWYNVHNRTIRSVP
jgi:hypothetical protein